jgi:hypothetical protein
VQESYTQTVADTYRKLADLLITQGRIAEAQQTLELLKLQELNDFNRGTRAPEPLTQLKLNTAEQQIKAKHGTLIAFGNTFYQCEQQTCLQLETLRSQYKKLSQEFYQLAAQLTQKAEENRRTQIAAGTDDFIASADKVVSAQPNSVLIYPLILPDKVHLLWAAKGGILNNAVCPLSEAELNRTISKFQNLLRDRSSSLQQIKAVGKQLYDCLIKPLEPELEANNIRHLILAPIAPPTLSPSVPSSMVSSF